MVRIYRRKEFSVYSGNGGFIVHNTKKEFANGHTHISNFHTAKFLIDMSIRKLIPYKVSPYLLESLMRLSNDEIYTEKIRKEILRVSKKKAKHK